MNMTSMGFDDSSDDRQPQPGSSRLRGVKRFEHSRDFFGCQPASVVAHHDPNALSPGSARAARAHRETSGAAHGVDRVIVKIVQNLKEQTAISLTDGQDRVDIDVDLQLRSPPFGDLRGGQTLGKKRFEREALFVERERSAVFEEIGHDPIGAFHTEQNPVDLSLQFGTIVQIPSQQGREALDSRERIADFVRHRRRHPPERGEIAGAFQLGLELDDAGAVVKREHGKERPVALIERSSRRDRDFVHPASEIFPIPDELEAARASIDDGGSFFAQAFEHLRRKAGQTFGRALHQRIGDVDEHASKVERHRSVAERFEETFEHHSEPLSLLHLGAQPPHLVLQTGPRLGMRPIRRRRLTLCAARRRRFALREHRFDLG